MESLLQVLLIFWTGHQSRRWNYGISPFMYGLNETQEPDGEAEAHGL